MYQSNPGLIIGFHGCDMSVRDQVVTMETLLRPSENAYDWLGNGIYFWENNLNRAYAFSKELMLRANAKSKIETPSAVGAILDMGFCLDLLNEEHIEMVKKSFITLSQSYELLNLPMPINSNVGLSADLLLRDLDCAVIENLHNRRKQDNIKPFDSVRSAFIEGNALYPNAGFKDKNHIQLCIRNPNCIKGYFIPRTASDDWPVP